MPCGHASPFLPLLLPLSPTLSVVAATRLDVPLPAMSARRDQLRSPDVRVAPAEKARLREIADTAGIAVAELVRARALGRPVVSRTDATTTFGASRMCPRFVPA